MINFPDNPSEGQSFTSGLFTWIYTNGLWVSAGRSSNPAAQLATDIAALQSNQGSYKSFKVQSGYTINPDDSGCLIRLDTTATYNLPDPATVTGKRFMFSVTASSGITLQTPTGNIILYDISTPSRGVPNKVLVALFSNGIDYVVEYSRNWTLTAEYPLAPATMSALATAISNAIASYYTKTEIDNNIYTKTQIDTNIYTKTQINTNIYNKAQSDTNLSNYDPYNALASKFTVYKIGSVIAASYQSTGGAMPAGTTVAAYKTNGTGLPIAGTWKLLRTMTENTSPAVGTWVSEALMIRAL